MITISSTPPPPPQSPHPFFFTPSSPLLLPFESVLPPLTFRTCPHTLSIKSAVEKKKEKKKKNSREDLKASSY